MCGISGVVYQDAPPAEALLRRMAAELAHRGPDAEGIKISGNAGLVHRRLKIIDLSEAANQPMTAGDGKIDIVFNGEIYNFRDLRTELEGRGIAFTTQSDTEVILRAFEAWGTNAFRRLNGIFAFAILDRRAKPEKTYLVRDRWGIKPLFYAARNSKFAFASELKPLLTLDWISREIDPETLFLYLKFSHVPTPRAIFRDIRQLEPGTFLRYSDGEVVREKYFSPLEFSQPRANGTHSESEWLERLDGVFKRVVDRQLIADVPVGCFLSGGIDSSLIALTWRELRTEPLKTFTIGYSERRYDEAPFARAVAKHIGADHHEIQVSAADLVDLIPRVPEYFDQPFADPTLLPSLILSRAARQEVTVALAGDGGDELFLGYEYARALRRLALVAHTPLSVRKVAALAAVGISKFLPRRRRHQLQKAADIVQFEDKKQMLQYFIGTIGPLHLDRLAKLVRGGDELKKNIGPAYEMWPEIEQLSWPAIIDQAFLRTFLTDTVLTKTDRAGMAYGLEARVPFLDDEMVEFAADLPAQWKDRHGQSKYLLRQLLRSKLPGELWKRKKQGFSIPIPEWLRGTLRPLMEHYLDPKYVERGGHFDPYHVSQIASEHLSGRANHSHLLWSLLSFQLWKERYL